MRGEHLDTRYHHDRRYPNHGAWVSKLPAERFDAPFKGHDYYFSRGVWYRPHGRGFIVVGPPAGLYVPNLPPHYTTLWVVGGVPYFYANDVFYVYRGASRGYETVPPPPNAKTNRASAVHRPPPSASTQLFVYPTRRESVGNETKDKRACEQWAARETGFDRAAAVTHSTQTPSSPSRAAYDRAIEACLEGRGYTAH